MSKTEAVARIASYARGLVVAVAYSVLLFGLLAVLVAM